VIHWLYRSLGEAMAVKGTGQFSFVEALLPEGLGRSGRLDRLSGLVKWYRFEKLFAGLRDEGPGRAGRVTARY